MARKSTIEVVCITTPDCPRNKEFEDLLKLVPDGRMIDFYTQDLDDLAVVAKHRVLPVPTFLILSGSKVVGRIVNPPKNDDMVEILQNAMSSFTK
jgi:hypothetical protein